MSGNPYGSLSLGKIMKARWDHFTWKLHHALIDTKQAFRYLFKGEYVNGAFTGGYYESGELHLTPADIYSIHAETIMPGTINVKDIKVNGNINIGQSEGKIVTIAVAKDMVDSSAINIKVKEAVDKQIDKSTFDQAMRNTFGINRTQR